MIPDVSRDRRGSPGNSDLSYRYRAGFTPRFFPCGFIVGNLALGDLGHDLAGKLKPASRYFGWQFQPSSRAALDCTPREPAAL